MSKFRDSQITKKVRNNAGSKLYEIVETFVCLFVSLMERIPPQANVGACIILYSEGGGRRGADGSHIKLVTMKLGGGNTSPVAKETVVTARILKLRARR